MVKHKLKQPPNSCTTSDPDMEEFVQDGWVVVKKQKVTILIPPLPLTEQCTIRSPKRIPSQPVTTKEVDHIIAAPLPDPPLPVEKTMSLATKKPVRTFSNPPGSKPRVTAGNHSTYKFKSCKRVGICGAQEARKHCGSLLSGHMLVNPNMRALNLERKLKKAGGLNNWLLSLGLGQFVKIFRAKRVGKVQLVNLTMKELKDMGANAVGPRRKLMHAIDCLW
uniref:uncharacterized protein LOC122604079 n=1 Tax=Erigeron canadensis TaxID=72917 RepID=UPI001CB9008B|nr:uncharacterized protein LOC122604079 [Erigeron canadensis]XP_043632913.1 uncharacterized protein LOC122604079 [Erigeron canadensis]